MTWTLAIATATPRIGVALRGPDGPVAELTLQAGRRHGETLAPAVVALTNLTGVGLDRVERVAVDIGPGLFTGLRVGVATAKAFASALGVGVVGCSSLEVLAHPHRHAGRPVAAVVDARRGEVFWALYEPAPDGAGTGSAGPRPGGMVAVTEPEVIAPSLLAEKLVLAEKRAGLGPVLCTGDGARRYLAGAGGLEVAAEQFDHPSPAVLAGISEGRPTVEPALITPCYLRGADVRIGWDQR